jgi:hypothetical protein
MGKLKLEIIFTSQIASCILESVVPVNTPISAQVANTFEDQNNLAATTIADGSSIYKWAYPAIFFFSLYSSK